MGDCEQIAKRMHIMMIHSRDAKRDGKIPPPSCGMLTGLLNMVAVEALNDHDDDNDSSDDEPTPKKTEKHHQRPRQTTHRMTLEVHVTSTGGGKPISPGPRKRPLEIPVDN